MMAQSMARNFYAPSHNAMLMVAPSMEFTIYSEWLKEGYAQADKTKYDIKTCGKKFD